MIAELNTASDLLHAALDRYLDACSDVRNTYMQGNIVNNVSPELMSCVTNELLLVASYKSKIQQAKAAISAARNCASTNVPITILPIEVLTRIFWLVVDSQQCNASGKLLGRDQIMFPKHPVYLSHVCTHWRQVVLAAPVLWSHINFPSQSLDQRLRVRAEVYMARSGRSLLDIHIVESHEFGQTRSNVVGELVEFLTPVAARIRSLDTDLSLRPELKRGKHCCSILSTCFANCIPGTLTQLSIRRGGGGSCGFIESNENPVSQESILLDLPEQTLEDLWLSVTVLRLNGSYPYWTSKAYHGLVELRLGTLGSLTIAESQLVAILASSPGLRVLDFNLHITDHLPRNASNIPVRLDDLEFLSPGSMTPKQLGHFLCLLAPGSKPLQVLLFKHESYRPEVLMPLSNPRIIQFFARSNVTKICGLVFDSFLEAIELLRLAPHLQTLVLVEFRAKGISELDALVIDVSLNSLCMHCCISLNLHDLRHFIERLQVQTLTLWRCTFQGGQSMINQEELQVELSDLCSVVRLLPWNEPNPVGEWDPMVLCPNC